MMSVVLISLNGSLTQMDPMLRDEDNIRLHSQPEGN